MTLTQPLLSAIASRLFLTRPATLLVVSLLCGTSFGRAATLSWSGNGVAGVWSDSANWGLAGTPSTGDTLIFPSGAAKLSNTNNLAGLVLNEIRFGGGVGGYAIFGNGFSLTNGIQATNASGQNLIAPDITLAARAITFTVGANATLNLGGVLAGPAEVVKSGAGTLAYTGGSVNAYTNRTLVNQGTLRLNRTGFLDSSLHGPLVIGDGFGGVNADVVELGGIEQMNDNIPVTISGSGLLDLAGTSEFFGSLAGSGNLVLGGASPRIGVNGTSTVFDGIISGLGDIRKRGPGTLTLNGNNTYPSTQIEGGTLIFNGFQPTNLVNVTTGTTVGGSGGVGIITALGGGTVSPGSSPGVLSCSNLVLGAGSTFKVELNGRVPGPGFDQLSVQGTNNITGSSLALIIGPGFAPLEGEELVILDNDKAEAITGTFSGLSEGNIITVGPLSFRISYVGGTGNDITLTMTNPPARAINYLIGGGNGNPYVDVNECNNLRLIITNTIGVPLTGVSATLASATPGVSIMQPASSYPTVPVAGTATNLIAFQMATQPTFACGTPINLVLSLVTDSGSFAVPFTIFSASVSSPVRFDYDISTNINDLTTIDLPLAVSGISNAIVKVTVSLFVTHSFDGDLSFTLFAPNGTSVDLSSNNGVSGDNYGAACGTEALRTTFDDSGSTSITAGTPPYTNTYRPESPLSAFYGLSGADVNGPWTLRVKDGAVGDQGNLKCWSLFLTPLNCPDGGGVCSICANNTIAGSIGQGDAYLSDRLSRSGQASSCQSPTTCSGPVNFGPVWFEAFRFQNGPADACINVSLSAPTTDLFSAAYLNSYDTNDLCTNYLADAGASTLETFPTPLAYSFIAPSNSTFFVLVNSIEGASGPYQLTVTGGDCRPILNIDRAPQNKVRVDWPASAGGFLLEGAPDLTPTNWSPITNVPALNGGRYSVTDELTTNKFYRLRKP